MSDKPWLTSWALGSIALGGASLLVPLYVVELGGGAEALGLLAALAALAGVPGAIGVGRLVDALDRRRAFVVGSLALASLSLAVIPLANTLWLVVVANAFIWLAFAAATPVLTLLVVGDATGAERSRRIAGLNTYQGYGWTGGLALGAVWTPLAGWTVGAGALGAHRLFFGTCATFAFLAAAGSLRTLPADPVRDVGIEGAIEEHEAAARVHGRGGLAAGAGVAYVTGAVIRLAHLVEGVRPEVLARRFTPALATYFVAVLLFFAGFAVFFAPLPLFLRESGFSTAGVYALYVVASLGTAASSLWAGTLAERVDVGLLHAGGLLTRGTALPAVGFVVAALSATPIGLAATGATFLVIGIAWAVVAISGASLVTGLAPAPVRGEALGVYIALSALAGGLGSVLGGWLAAIDFTVAFVVAGALVVVGAGLVLVVRRAEPEPASEGAVS